MTGERNDERQRETKRRDETNRILFYVINFMTDINFFRYFIKFFYTFLKISSISRNPVAFEPARAKILTRGFQGQKERVLWERVRKF